MTDKESIKLKIKALLAKTTENGATESEMILAMEKASELMEKYYINHNDLTDPFLGEKCVFGKADLFKTSYKLGYFYTGLARLFDCHYYYNAKEITFFGFENDVELCIYFYKLIVRTCLNESERFKLTRDYKQFQLRGLHGKTIVNSFIKGYIFRVCEKLDEMYQARQQERTTERGLVLRSKSDKVKEAYEKEGIQVRVVKSTPISVSKDVYRKGQESGDKFSITQGIKSSSVNNTKQLQI